MTVYEPLILMISFVVLVVAILRKELIHPDGLTSVGWILNKMNL